VFGELEHPLKAPLEQALNEWGGGGIALCLPEKVNENHISMILEAAKAVLETDRHYFVLVQQSEMGIAAFARTLHREQPDITTCVITLSPDSNNTIEAILTEVRYSLPMIFYWLRAVVKGLLPNARPH